MLEEHDKPTGRSSVDAAIEAFQNSLTITDILESLTEGIVVVDATGTIIIVNQRAEELFGYREDEIVGQSLGVLLPGKYEASHTQFVDIYFRNPWQRHLGQGMDLVGQRKDGTELPLEISLSHVDTPVGKMAIAFITDITERRQIEQELRLRNKELDSFAHTVAHDLNASMSLIVGYSDTLAAIHRTLSPDELHNYLLLIARNGRKMSNIINELLLFANMRKEDVPLKPLNMSLIVTEALRRLSYEIDAAEAEIIQPDSYPQAIGYSAWVEEVWFNYISNGLKYGGQPPRLELGSTVHKDDTVSFWVRDNGEGLTPGQRAVVFNPSSQTGMLRVKGHGLGLSIVRRIIEKLNGRVYVQSKLGEGSTFGFTLPVDEEADE